MDGSGLRGSDLGFRFWGFGLWVWGQIEIKIFPWNLLRILQGRMLSLKGSRKVEHVGYMLTED